MKRLLVAAVVLLLAAPAAFAQRDVLLTDDGTAYAASFEWAWEHPEVKTTSSTYLVLTIQRTGEQPQRLFVPATLQGGANTNPALAYDSDSATLFVFWQHWPNAMSSELRFIAYHRETGWTTPTSFEKAAYRLRRNLRIALTSLA
ncbi:MAG TPA: hypothetical protein VG106_10945, partial [Vicinamibacterales bacterium]|nr:hypothetical protein [Vicinamibacterales bacterium]